MEFSIFKEKNLKPDDAMLLKELKGSFTYYTGLSDMTNNYKTEWVFYKSSGWHQKTADRKKALCYLIPLKEKFLIRMTIRDRERAHLLADEAVSFAHEAMLAAKKYSEGLLMEFVVSDENSYFECKMFLSEIMKLR